MILSETGDLFGPKPKVTKTAFKQNKPLPVDKKYVFPGFPDLRGSKAIAIDVETNDPYLKKSGSGSLQASHDDYPAEYEPYLAGVAVATPEGFTGYYPIRHKVGRQDFDSDNLDANNVLNWLRDQLGTNIPKVGTNIGYDVDWLASYGVHVGGSLYDVAHLGALLDEEADGYSLGALCARYGLDGKDETELYHWLAVCFGGKATRTEQAGRIAYAPAALVAPYAESDVRMPLDLMSKMMPLIRQEGLLEVLQLETALVPILVKMRRKGVAVDLSYAEQLRDQLVDKEHIIQARWPGVDFNSRDALVRLFEDRGWEVPIHPDTGRPTFQKDALAYIKGPIGDDIRAYRQAEKIRRDYVESVVLEGNIRGRVHTTFNQLRKDKEGQKGSAGAATGRFSSSKPNMQQMPGETWFRRCFVPDGDQWAAIDYSSIEVRLLAHDAVGRNAQALRQQYVDDPSTDYHNFTMDLIERETGIQMARKAVKGVNFSAIYGSGPKSVAYKLGISVQDAKSLLDSYHKALPYVRSTMDKYANEAIKEGCVRTILGRKRRFVWWEPADFEARGSIYANKDRDFIERQVKEGGFRAGSRLAFTYKALNARIQGSAADLMKLALVKVVEAGIPMPALTVHDELDWSDANNAELAEAKRIMEGCYEFSVPIRCDLETGATWGDSME